MAYPSELQPNDGMHPWSAGVRCVAVTRMTRSLDFYLALGCEVASTADGWVLLRAESEQFVLAQSPAVRSARAPVLRVRTGDLVALGRRLKHVGATVGAPS